MIIFKLGSTSYFLMEKSYTQVKIMIVSLPLFILPSQYFHHTSSGHLIKIMIDPSPVLGKHPHCAWHQKSAMGSFATTPRYLLLSLLQRVPGQYFPLLYRDSLPCRALKLHTGLLTPPIPWPWRRHIASKHTWLYLIPLLWIIQEGRKNGKKDWGQEGKKARSKPKGSTQMEE